MPFQISPGVNVTEKDLTNIVPAVATTIGGIAGNFQWGPCEERVLVDSENNLVANFGKPNNDNAEYWWTAANFLGYTNALQVVRKVDTDARNATAVPLLGRGDSVEGTSLNAEYLILNQDDYDGTVAGATLPGMDSTGISATGIGHWVAKWPGVLGNSLQVSVSDHPALVYGGANGVSAGAAHVGVGSATNAINVSAIWAGKGEVAVGDLIELGSGTDYTVTGFTGDTSPTIGSKNGTTQETYNYTHITVTPDIVAADAGTGLTATVKWAYAGNFSATPDTSTDAAKYGAANDEVQIAVIDEDGLFSGARGTVLETFSASKAKDAKRFDGEGNYYVTVVNEQSKYIWWGDHPDALVTVDGTTAGGQGRAWGDTFVNVENAVASEGAYEGGTFERLARNFYGSLALGSNGTALSNANYYTNGYDLFQDSETVDVNLILGGPAEATLAGQLIDLVDARKDCLAFLSPRKTDVVNKTASAAQAAAVDYYNNTLNKSSSYGVFDSGWKYQYDRYNDVYRWVPLNADVAGLCARTENDNDAWFSPAGFNRGQIRNIVKLAYNPRKAHRDNLYKNNLNPVVAFPGEGTILFGDKTMQRKPSAFDRINVRRLFIVLEKAIATAAKYQLFEFNDEFTRSNFVNMVEPFLRDVQGRRGIYDFRVVCDETNNTGEVIDRNEFVADIFIKPARSINFIQLNFVAVRTGVDFSEVAGA